MDDIIAAFNEWALDRQHPDAQPLDAPIIRLLGFDENDSTIEDGIALLEPLKTRYPGFFKAYDYGWAFRPINYLNAHDAHLQFLLLGYLTQVWELFGERIELPDLSNILARVVNHTEISPYVASKNPYKFIVLTNWFFKAVDDIYRTHFFLNRYGSQLHQNSVSHDGNFIKSSFIGSRFVEIAVNHDFQVAMRLMLQYLQPIVFVDSFGNTGLSPITFPNTMISNLNIEMQKMLGYTDPFEIKLDRNTQCAIYLTTIFVLFHEASHIAIGDFESEIAQAMREDSIEGTTKEIMVDLFATQQYQLFLQNYKSYFQFLLKDTELSSEFVYFNFGPQSFYTIAKIRYLARIVFGISSKTIIEGNERHVNLTDALNAIDDRQKAFETYSMSTLAKAFPENPKYVQDMFTNLASEFTVPEILLDMLATRLIFKKESTFSEHYKNKISRKS